MVNWAEQPFRTMLFAPGNHPRKVAKVGTFGADAIVLDLEDAVAVGPGLAVGARQCGRRRSEKNRERSENGNARNTAGAAEKGSGNTGAPHDSSPCLSLSWNAQGTASPARIARVCP